MSRLCTCECPAWTICFDKFAGWEHQQRNIGLVVLCLFCFPPYWIDPLAPNGVSGSSQVVFWHFDRSIRIPIFNMQYGTTLKACKIVTFDPKPMKLCNLIFRTVYSQNRNIDIACARIAKRWVWYQVFKWNLTWNLLVRQWIFLESHS